MHGPPQVSAFARFPTQQIFSMAEMRLSAESCRVLTLLRLVRLSIPSIFLPRCQWCFVCDDDAVLIRGECTKRRISP